MVFTWTGKLMFDGGAPSFPCRDRDILTDVKTNWYIFERCHKKYNIQYIAPNDTSVEVGSIEWASLYMTG